MSGLPSASESEPLVKAYRLSRPVKRPICRRAVPQFRSMAKPLRPILDRPRPRVVALLAPKVIPSSKTGQAIFSGRHFGTSRSRKAGRRGRSRAQTKRSMYPPVGGISAICNPRRLRGAAPCALDFSEFLQGTKVIGARLVLKGLRPVGPRDFTDVEITP